MNNNNKILTVSYGTFSCTLEGFDDSFDTMKAIAEYFRDLAADDRYFGAEPPQPDAEMLARIAERKVERRVEAREHDGRIMLKAHEETVAHTPAPTSEAAAEAEDAPQARETATEPAPTAQTGAPENDAAAATKDAAALPPELQAKASFEPVAEETAPALRAQQNAPTADVLAPETKAEGINTVQVSDASLPAETPSGTGAPQATTEGAERAEPSETDVDDADHTVDAAAAFFADSTVVDADEPDAEEAISVGDFANYTARMDADAPPPSDDLQDFTVEDVARPGPVGSTESIVEKLDRIRAVVAQQEDAAPDAAYEEEDTATAEVIVKQAVTSDLAKEEENEAVAEAAKDITSALEFDDASEARISASEIAIHEEDDLDAILKRIEGGDDDDELDTPVDLSADIDDDEPAENLFDASDEPEADAPEVHGRVLRVNRADLEAALESGDLEEYGDDAIEEGGDLSALDGEIPKEHQEHTPASSARGGLPEIDTDPSQDLSRLMAEADQHMQEPEGRTRRSAFAHLRAAVAARFADRSMEEQDTKGAQNAEAYRSDLAEVVKPRRPVASSTRSERPTEAGAAPLKLVAEQRINAEEISARGPVAPRRVGTDEDIDLAEDSAFAEYAEERGASSLPELLEAAASYLSFVEGHEQFSRPQLMARVRQADCGDFSREDGLRSFGQLLRAGKIEKIKGGRFAASQAIGYKPDHRAAG
ncbi:hypothetical protein [Roseobacter weihaiensis]|uniref:hypothetical protein n=1 Tax=Roseobacter weihaiensis TaxID=2763262 RepID=UPI001D0AC688|nr:hypothetical protein [Roseobacter sp. H9]